MAQVLGDNPFPHAPRNRTVAIFLGEPPAPHALAAAAAREDEELRLGTREGPTTNPAAKTQPLLCRGI